MRAIVAVGLVSLLAACSSTDRYYHTNFEPYPDGKFRYSTDILWPYSDEERKQWLQQYLDDNGMCPNGYEILERKEYYKNKSAIGDLKTEILYGQCK